jgi:periplasmic divalent cation tolerance protein
MERDVIVVFITAPSREVAHQIATGLLEKKLAACVNVVPAIQSIYSWQGAVCADDEVLLIVKSRAALFDEKLLPAVQDMHPYDVPEIIALPVVMGSQSYLDWVGDETEAN